MFEIQLQEKQEKRRESEEEVHILLGTRTALRENYSH